MKARLRSKNPAPRGDAEPRKPAEAVWSEHREQVQFFQDVRKLFRRFPCLSDLLMAVPNGGDRHPATGMRMRAEGQRPGVPDIFLAVPRNGYHGLWIELKRERGGRLSDAQRRVIGLLRGQGYRVEVARGRAEAWDFLLDYLGVRDGDE